MPVPQGGASHKYTAAALEPVTKVVRRRIKQFKFINSQEDARDGPDIELLGIGTLCRIPDRFIYYTL